MVKSTIDDRTGMLKQWIYILAVMLVVLFGPDLKSGIFGSSGSSDFENRVRDLEGQNAFHEPMQNDIEHNGESIQNLELSTRQLLTQVEALVADVEAMQEREYARWSKK